VKTLRQHQLEAVEACMKATKGQINCPTGTGKTVIEEEIVKRNILDKRSKGEYEGVYVIVSPRILLSYQHLANFNKELLSEDLDFISLNVNSGKFTGTDLELLKASLGLQAYEIVSTTNPKDIMGKYQWCFNQSKPLIISATYDSVWAVEQSKIPVTVYLFDEAHYMVDTNGAFNAATKYPAEKMYFFTATPKLTDSDKGMGQNNKELFGDVISTKSPKEMIEAGEMVKPRLHLILCGDNFSNGDYSYDHKSTATLIIKAFERHKAIIKKDSIDGYKVGAKLLVVTEGQLSLQGIFNTPEWKDYCSKNNVFALSSDFGIYDNNGDVENRPDNNNKNKADFLKAVSNLLPEDDAILLHVDILAEGIDIPGITGCMLFRNVGRIKFLQNIGRASRLCLLDRLSLYNGTLNPCDFVNYVKPYAWVILPDFSVNSSDVTYRCKEIVREMRREFGFSSAEMVITGNRNSATVIEDIDSVNEHERQVRSINHMVHEWIHQFEDGEASEHMEDICELVNKLDDNNKADLFEMLGKKIKIV